MHGIGGSTLRGGQTVFHGLRMWGQLFRAAVFFAAFTTVAVPAWTLWHRTTGAEWYAAGMVTLAEAKLVARLRPGLGPGGPLRGRHAARAPHPRHRRLGPGVRRRASGSRPRCSRAPGSARMSGAGLIGLFLVVFWYRGAQLGRQKRIRGAEMVTAGELRRRRAGPPTSAR